jgi:hypothetical protein
MQESWVRGNKNHSIGSFLLLISIIPSAKRSEAELVNKEN